MKSHIDCDEVFVARAEVPARSEAAIQQLERWRLSPWLPGALVNGQVTVKAQGTPEGGDHASPRMQLQVQHDAALLGAGASAAAFAGTLGRKTPVVVKYITTQERFVSLRRTDLWLEHAAARNPEIRSHFLTSRAWFSTTVGPGHAHAVQGVIQDDATADGSILGKSYLEGVPATGRQEAGARLGFELGRALIHLNRHSSPGEALVHLDIKPTNYAVTLGGDGAPVAVRIFDNGSLVRDGSEPKTIEFAEGMTDYRAFGGRRGAHEEKTNLYSAAALNRLGFLGDRMHAFAVACNVLHAVTRERHKGNLARVRSLSLVGHQGLRALLQGALQDDPAQRLSLKDLTVGLKAIGIELTRNRLALALADLQKRRKADSPATNAERTIAEQLAALTSGQ